MMLRQCGSDISTKSDFIFLIIGRTILAVSFTVVEALNISFMRFFISLSDPIFHKISSSSYVAFAFSLSSIILSAII